MANLVNAKFLKIPKQRIVRRRSLQSGVREIHVRPKKLERI